MLPFVGMAMEKCWYDTAMCLRAIDPEKQSGFAGANSPNAVLPSLSLVPLRKEPITLSDLVPTQLKLFLNPKP